MRKIKKKFARPLRPWDKQRIDAERELLASFGLKNKKELWRTEATLRKYRRLARDFAAGRNKKQEETVLKKLVRLGVLGENAGLDDILALGVKDFLERRLQTVLQKKELANTMKHARQMVVHGRVEISGRKITYPSYLVTREEENKISLAEPKTKVKKIEVEKSAAKEEAG